MLDDDTEIPRPARRISPVARALRPVQLRIGKLQEQIAFLVARNLHAMRRPDDRVGAADVVGRRAELAEALADLELTVAELPEALRLDGRISDTRAAITRLDQALDILDADPAH